MANIVRDVNNLITWADSLYRRDTRESNNEAMMLYVLAYRILGQATQADGWHFEEGCAHL